MRETLKTERLILRPFAKTDSKTLMSLAGDIEVAKATGRLPHPYTHADAVNWISVTHSISGANYIYAIANQDNHLIGCVSLIQVDAGLELGYWLGQAFWHQGYMREAVDAVLKEARQTLPSTTLSANVFTDNPRSAALLLSFGFKNTDYVSEYCVARGHPVACHRLERELIREAVDA